MTYFKELDTGDMAIIVSGGVFKQCKLFTMDGNLFAQDGSGFVRIAADGSTSKASVRIHKLVTDTPLFRDKLGRLSLEKTGNKALTNDHQQKLIGELE